MTRIGYIGKPVDQSQGKEDSRIVPESGARVALLYPVQSRPADRSAFRQNGYWYAPPPPSVANVRAELAQSADHG